MLFYIDCSQFINHKKYNNTMSILKQVGEYLYIRKKDDAVPRSSFLKAMHGINRLSILLFLFAMIVLVIRLFIRKG